MYLEGDRDGYIEIGETQLMNKLSRSTMLCVSQ